MITSSMITNLATRIDKLFRPQRTSHITTSPSITSQREPMMKVYKRAKYIVGQITRSGNLIEFARFSSIDEAKYYVLYDGPLINKCWVFTLNTKSRDPHPIDCNSITSMINHNI